MWTLPTGASPAGPILVWADALIANKVSNTTREENRWQTLRMTTRALLPLNVLPTNFIGCTANYRPNPPTAQIRFILQLGADPDRRVSARGSPGSVPTSATHSRESGAIPRTRWLEAFAILPILRRIETSRANRSPGSDPNPQIATWSDY